MNNNYNENLYRPNVGIVLLNENNLIFTGERNVSYSEVKSTQWQMPQGGIDENESIDDAMYRELLEETGVKKENIKLISKTKNWIYYDIPENLIGKSYTIKNNNIYYKGQKQIWYLLKFIGKDSDINLNNHHEIEFINWKWINAQSLIDNIVEFKKQTYVNVLKEFKLIVE